MPRLMGVDIPNDKQIQYSLTYLYGIGLYSAREACEKLGIDPTRKASDIHEDELGRIAPGAPPAVVDEIDALFALQASQQSFIKIQGLSLFNYLR